MSRRVTTKTEIKDRELALQALKTAGMSYRESGKNIFITSGRMANASIDLTTGEVTGDSDYGHNSGTLGGLRQSYAEAKFRSECLKQGISITERTTEKNGNVVLMWHMA